MTEQIIYTNNDTDDYQESPNSNNGGDAYVIFRWDDSWKHHRAYYGFNITSAPAASVINSVYFRTHFNVSGVDQWINFRRIIEIWDEDTLTWNDSPDTTPTNEYTHFLPNSDGVKSYDITNLYKDAKNIGNELSIRIYQIQNYNGGCITGSKESGTGAAIVITYGVPVTDYYVKVGGNDTLDGQSWANAWKTINKAATTVVDGATVHIGFGDYVLEPASNKIAPQNIGTSGIYYKPEQAPGGAAAPTVSIEQNP